mmetsp:Transcript_24145/g.54221  ORF Transcript_24145/g.54221 Transcript_24145/m.54221 type:complete len:375 (-) Transcript_24145:586-1710(-)
MASASSLLLMASPPPLSIIAHSNCSGCFTCEQLRMQRICSSSASIPPLPTASCMAASSSQTCPSSHAAMAGTSCSQHSEAAGRRRRRSLMLSCCRSVRESEESRCSRAPVRTRALALVSSDAGERSSCVMVKTTFLPSNFSILSATSSSSTSARSRRVSSSCSMLSSLLTSAISIRSTPSSSTRSCSSCLLASPAVSSSSSSSSSSSNGKRSRQTSGCVRIELRASVAASWRLSPRRSRSRRRRARGARILCEETSKRARTRKICRLSSRSSLLTSSSRSSSSSSSRQVNSSRPPARAARTAKGGRESRRRRRSWRAATLRLIHKSFMFLCWRERGADGSAEEGGKEKRSRALVSSMERMGSSAMLSSICSQWS